MVATEEKQRAVEEGLKGKVPAIFNISNQQGDLIIGNAEVIIAQLEVSKENMRKVYEDTKAAFEEIQKDWMSVKTQWDNLNENIHDQQRLIAIMKHYRRIPDADKRLQTNVKAPEGIVYESSVKRIKWLKGAVQVLKDANEFMELPKLVDLVLEIPEVLEEAKKSEKYKAVGLNGPRWAGIESLTKHIKQVLKGKQESALFKPTITMYKGLVGLVEWTTMEDGKVVPDANHIKQFMFGHK